MPINKFESKNILQPYMDALRKIFLDALKEFKEKHFDPAFNSTTNSCIINNLIVKHAKINLLDNDDIRFRENHGCLYLIIRDQFIA